MSEATDLKSRIEAILWRNMFCKGGGSIAKESREKVLAAILTLVEEELEKES